MGGYDDYFVVTQPKLIYTTNLNTYCYVYANSSLMPTKVANLKAKYNLITLVNGR